MLLEEKAKELLARYPEFIPAWEATTNKNVRYALLVGMRQAAREVQSDTTLHTR